MNSKFAEVFNEMKKNKGAMIGLGLIIFFFLLAIFAPLISPYSPEKVTNQFSIPPMWVESGSSTFIFGTDDVGRDLLSRIIYGSRISMLYGLLVVLLSVSVGTILGVIAGFYGGLIDQQIMRLVDVLMALPSILLAIVIMAILGPGVGNAIIAVSIVAVPSFIRIVRASVLQEKKKQYVIAASSYGASSFRLMFVEILPNCMAPLIVQASLCFSDGILNTAALGFLGLGAQPPTPEWGTMLADSRAFIESSPWMVTIPGICILLVVLAFNLLGDGLRDVLDPKLKKS